MEFKVAAVHAAPVFMDTWRSVDKAVELVMQAKQEAIELLVFPEVFLPGYPYFIDCYAPRMMDTTIAAYQNASVEIGGPEIRKIQNAARDAKVAVVMGISERMRGGHTCFNSQVFIERDGSVLGVHRKLQPTYAERMVWGQGGGHTLRTFDSSVGIIGGLVCWEHTMNLARQALIQQRQQVHAASWPALSTLTGLEDAADSQIEAMMKNHAISGQCFVITASNPIDKGCLEWMDKNLGPQKDVREGGGWSSIIHPFTTYIAGPHTGGEEKLVSGVINLNDLDRLKVWIDGNGHYSRPEIVRMTRDPRPIWMDEGLGSAPVIHERTENDTRTAEQDHGESRGTRLTSL